MFSTGKVKHDSTAFSNGAGTARHHAPAHHGGLPDTSGFAHPHTNIAAFGLDHGMKVADFGSGSGHYTIAIAEQLQNSGHVYAIDVQRDLLKRTHNEAAKLGLKNVSVIWGDLEASGSTKIANHHIDLVLISNTLFQIEEKAAVIEEARRILKPTGRLVLIDWSDSFGGMGPHKNDVLKKEAALTLAKSGGFELVREFSAGAHHYGLMMRMAPHAHKN
ncbi:MAG: class I SAM-dependent methyltransferase [bacterium]|nr:class I SAM-dependent methyltransferase [bacterium]